MRRAAGLNAGARGRNNLRPPGFTGQSWPRTRSVEPGILPMRASGAGGSVGATRPALSTARYFFLAPLRVAPARLATDLPAPLAPLLAERAAELAPLAAEPAAFLALLPADLA